MQFKINRFFLAFFILGIIIPIHITLIPMFIIYPLALQLDSYRAKNMKAYRIYSENVTDYNSAEAPDHVSIVQQDFPVIDEVPTIMVPKHSINILELSLEAAES